MFDPDQPRKVTLSLTDNFSRRTTGSGFTAPARLRRETSVRALRFGEKRLPIVARDGLNSRMRSRYGTGELYGFDFCALSAARIRELSSAPFRSQPCPFKAAAPGKAVPRCNKKGGVCSLRLLEQGADERVEGKAEPVITCPNRFLEGSLVAQWVGETLLGTPTPAVISELPFLMGEIQSEEGEEDAVGKIDEVLVNAEGSTLRWCALEFQAVYFSGMSMENDFKVMREWAGPGGRSRRCSAVRTSGRPGRSG